MSTANTDKYFKAFQIKKISDISEAELKRRYRILAKKYHPDRGGSAVQFRFVHDAYAYLKKRMAEFKRIQNKKFFLKKYHYYSDGSIYDKEKKRWVKVKGRIIDTHAVSS